jgi:type IV pilus assembly protein PilC
MAQIAPARQFPFVWEGTDKRGKRIKGKMLAVSEAAVKADLRKQGVLAKKVKKESQVFKKGKKITPEDIALFARQLATMLQAGIPMVQCFDIIGTGHEKPSMQKLSQELPCTRHWASTPCTLTICS